MKHAIAAAALLLAAACSASSGPAPGLGGQDDWREFQGSWSAEGLRHSLDLGPTRRASLIDVTGSLLLTGPLRPSAGFQARVVAFSDSVDGLTGRSVWTDEVGDHLFSELKSSGPPGSLITGRFLGGTGRYADAVGEYSFRWEFLVDADEGEVSGRVVDLRGRVRADPAAHGKPRTP